MAWPSSVPVTDEAGEMVSGCRRRIHKVVATLTISSGHFRAAKTVRTPVAASRVVFQYGETE